jgi:replicative DNA helicase
MALASVQGGRQARPDGLQPPHDEIAEAHVCGALLFDDDGIDDVLGLLAADDFYLERYRRTFEAIAELRAAGTPIDTAQVGSWLRARERLTQVGGMGALIDMMNAVPAIGAKRLVAHARTVRSLARQRDLLALCQGTSARLYAGGIEDTGAFLESFEQDVFVLCQDDVAGARAERSLDSAKRIAVELASGRLPEHVPSGFHRLDRKLHGGFKPKHFSVVAGQTSMGKSVFAMNVAMHIAGLEGSAAYVASLEMGHDELTHRTACAMAGVDSEKVELRTINPSEFQRYMGALEHIGRLHCYVSDEAGQSIASVRAKARRLSVQLAREGRRLRIIVIDYLQLLKVSTSDKTKTREQQVAELARGLKQLAKDLDVHVMALSQLNDEASKRPKDEREPRLGDLRESKAIANDADQVIFVHRTGYEAERYGKADAPVRGDAKFILAKGRGLKPGSVDVLFDGARYRFENLPDGPEYG